MRKSLGSGAGRFIAGDWLEAIGGTFDLVVANPPYLSAAEMAGSPARLAPMTRGRARWRS
jgi:release factor glutamine methyltransferase